MKALLLFLLILLTTSDIIVGGYKELSDTSSQQYKDVTAFISTAFPELSQWKVASIKMQVVNGINYIVSLENADQNAVVKMYSTFSGQITVTSYTLNSQPQTIPQAKKTGNFVVVGNLSSKTDTSISSNTSFTNKSGNHGQNNTVKDVYLISNPLILDNFFVGGYRPVPDDQNSSYDQVWNQVIKRYPQLSGFLLIEVRRQVVAGLNYIFVAESAAKDEIMVIKVFQSLSNTYDITILQTNTAFGFSTEQILQFKDKCIEMNPDLAQYQLVYISNTSDISGLKLTFALDSNYVTADCSYNNGNQVVVFE